MMLWDTVHRGMLLLEEGTGSVSEKERLVEKIFENVLRSFFFFKL